MPFLRRRRGLVRGASRSLRRWRAWLCGVPLLVGTAVAADGDPARTYAECMAETRRNPESAFETALAWQGTGGGDAAQHCAATALFALQQYGEAARRFEKLAQEARTDAPIKAQILAQAAQAWLLAGSLDQAYAALNAALKLRPDDPELLIDRAQVLAENGSLWQAVDDLDRAIELAPDRADAFAFRAAAYRMLDSPDLAQADVERALGLDPQHPEALLERGILKRVRGDDDGARRDWLQVLLAAPGSVAAEKAQANLERMDVKAR